MTIVLAVFGITLAVLVWMDARRLITVRCIERAERLRIRFSNLRHQLVMHAGSGEMRERDRAFFFFFYDATRFMLLYPTTYRLFSTVYCEALSDPAPPDPPRLRRADLSEWMLPLLREYLRATDDLVQQFARPSALVRAYFADQSVIEFFRNMGKRRRELREQREQIEKWRTVGANALQATS